ncbi:hypothetical protein THRCLA_04955 [Thraustotheca clavata]|uniref:TIR domain-containing protein n=1 Tax=Thraustotheca clavata TaxID=74557 RepID=A0A1V9ZY22_9STRA|nr:hypothetical protein THRCLA_04955 [Thraustotheca clavata]
MEGKEIVNEAIQALDQPCTHICKKNTFVSKRMRQQLKRVGWMNMLLLIPNVLFNIYQLHERNQEGSDECIVHNDVRFFIRITLWATSGILFLPTTGYKAFQLYRVQNESLRITLCKRQLVASIPMGLKPPSSKPYVVRTFFLRLCEVIALGQIAMLAFTLIYIPLGMIESNWTWNCFSGLSYEIYVALVIVSFILSVCAYVVTWDFLVMFHHLRTHLLFQHCVSGDVHRSHDRPFGRSPKEILRFLIWMAIRDKNLDGLREALAKAKELEPGFAKLWYSGVHLRCWSLFARSQRNPLHLAIKMRQYEAFTLLLDAGFDPNAHDKVQLAEFGLRNIYQNVFYFFSHTYREPPSLYGPRGWFKQTLLTPLHVAVIRSDCQMVQELLQVGACPNVAAKSNVPTYATPPLFWATNVDVTKMLLEYNANQLYVPKNGFYMTAYEDAVINGRHAIARLLENWGSDIALTPLHDAAALGDAKLMEKFLSPYSVNTLGEQSNGLFRRTALHWAAIRGQVETAKVLLQNDATVNVYDTWGRTPLSWACYLNRVDVVEELLVNWKADPTVIDYLGQTIPIMCASRDGIDAAIFRLLRENGLPEFGTMSNGDTPLHIAVKLHNERTALALVRSGSSTTITNEEGVRAIDCATSTELQFNIKKEAGQRDVMISYSHAFQPFALKLRQSLEDNFLTTWMDLMDPTGINGGAVWRDEIANGIQNAAVVLCILSETYPESQWCMKELAFAKANNVPVVAVIAQTTEMTDELQVYLWSRQLVDFRSAILPRSPSSKEDIVVDNIIYNQQLASLLDGLRNEVELHRVEAGRRPTILTRQLSMQVPMQVLHKRFVFISHGRCHPDFAKHLKEELWKNGVVAYVENNHYGLSINEAIIKCEAFIPIFSVASSSSDAFSDQFSFAENREKRIIPILYSSNFLRPAHSYSLSRTKLVAHFNEAIGFEQSVQLLLHSFPWIQHEDDDEDDTEIVDAIPFTANEFRNHTGGALLQKHDDHKA